MGRRALRTPKGDLDLSNFLKTFDELPNPWDVGALFDREAPLEVEIGSGKGLFMRTAAEARPEINFLGIEVAHKYARHAAVGLAKRELTNGVMVDGDAARIFSELIPDDSLWAVHVYFPDPWWKKRHRRRRILRDPVVRDIEKKLRPDGRLHVWTDVEEYFLSALELLAEVTKLDGPIEVDETPAEHDMDYRTHFERRTRKNDEPVYRAEFRKV